MSKNTVEVKDTKREAWVDGLESFATPTFFHQPYFRSAFGINRRQEQVMTWQLPTGDSIQMYINPQNFVVSESKQIQDTRTKGGFVVQYWGENLTQITIDGTTGSSGIKGIGVLRDIYRSENRGFDLIARRQIESIGNAKSELDIEGSSANKVFSDVAESMRGSNFLLKPSLATLATNVTLFYQGVQYKGFFKDFKVIESVNKLGMFDYSMSFVATDTRGIRKNFMPWHKEPLADDAAGQILNGIGNSIRGLFNMPSQAPESFHPANAPYTFGGSSVSGIVGIRGSVASTVGDGSGLDKSSVFI